MYAQRAFAPNVVYVVRVEEVRRARCCDVNDVRNANPHCVEKAPLMSGDGGWSAARSPDVYRGIFLGK